MTWQIGLTLVVTAIVFFEFIREKWPPEITAFGGVTLLLLSGVLSAQSLQSVFANCAPLTIATMFVISAGLERTGVIVKLGFLVSRLAGRSWLRAMLAVLSHSGDRRHPHRRKPPTFLSARACGFR